MAESVLAEIAERKRRDVAARLDGVTFDPPPTCRSLRSALARPGARFILEVKKASPSGHRSRVTAEEAIGAYAPVADALSVLTDGPYFQGSFDDLRSARNRFGGPILAKDFIVDRRQVTEARLHGADAVLAILALLDDGEAASLMAEASRLAMDVIVEVHNEQELLRALSLGAEIVGINNRDLKSLKTDLAVTERLASHVPSDRVVISESGISGRRDVKRLSPCVDAFLVGSALMSSDDVADAARAMIYGRVKICGATDVEDADLAAKAGSTHIGLIFADRSSRRVGQQARAIVEEVHRQRLKAVGVFQDQPIEFLARTAHKLGLDAVQLHGDEDDLPSLRRELPEGCELWAACAVGKIADPERQGADRIVYDSRVNGHSGGTGRTFDWNIVAGRPQLANGFLAGGLRPDNARAAQRIGAYGIDVGSGVEAAPGRKDAAKLEAFFAALRPECRRIAECA